MCYEGKKEQFYKAIIGKWPFYVYFPIIPLLNSIVKKICDPQHDHVYPNLSYNEVRCTLTNSEDDLIQMKWSQNAAIHLSLHCLLW